MNLNLRKKIIKESKTIKSLTEECNLGQSTLKYWLQKHRKECQLNPKSKETSTSYELIRKLRKELEKTKKKENEFLKKTSAFFAKKID